MKKLDFTFTKMEGTGNSFVFADIRSPKNRVLWKKALGKTSRKAMAKHLCDPYTGIGADGFAIIQNTHKGAAVEWDFYNADGSKAEMCGNATRCVGLFLTKNIKKGRPFMLRTKAGNVLIDVHSIDNIEVEMTKPKKVLWKQRLTIRGKKIQYDFLNTGVPHVVIRVNNLDLGDKYKQLASLIQNHRRFLPQKTNVTFYEKLGPNRIATASYERGVKDFTKACGTGAVAAALSFAEKSPHKIKLVKLRVPGGLLKVDVSHDRPHLIGPARKIADFKIWM